MILNTIDSGKWFDLASSYEPSEHTGKWCDNVQTDLQGRCRRTSGPSGEELIHYADGTGTIDAIYGFVPASRWKRQFPDGTGPYAVYRRTMQHCCRSRNVTQQGGNVYNNSFFYRSGGPYQPGA